MFISFNRCVAKININNKEGDLMCMETDVILRTILYQIKTAKSIDEIERAVEVMCSKDMIAAVNEMAHKQNEQDNKQA